MENPNSDWVCTVDTANHIHGTNDDGDYSFYKQWVVDLDEKQELLIFNTKYKHMTVLAPTTTIKDDGTTKTYWDKVPDQAKALESFKHLQHVVALTFTENSAP